MALTVLFLKLDEQFETFPLCPLSRCCWFQLEMAGRTGRSGSSHRAGFGFDKEPPGLLKLLFRPHPALSLLSQATCNLGRPDSTMNDFRVSIGAPGLEIYGTTR